MLTLLGWSRAWLLWRVFRTHKHKALHRDLHPRTERRSAALKPSSQAAKGGAKVETMQLCLRRCHCWERRYRRLRLHLLNRGGNVPFASANAVVQNPHDRDVKAGNSKVTNQRKPNTNTEPLEPLYPLVPTSLCLPTGCGPSSSEPLLSDELSPNASGLW